MRTQPAETASPATTAALAREFMASPQFAANPSAVELDAAAFAARFHAGEALEQLPRIDTPTATTT